MNNTFINPLSAKFIKWSNTLKQIVGKLPTICLSVIDHFSGLALKGLKAEWIFNVFFSNFSRDVTLLANFRCVSDLISFKTLSLSIGYNLKENLGHNKP